ncbi:MAG: toxin-antitoxin system YwqK family antitoxin [Flavobacteriales bacterium]|nr:toxin-antitoxin system YwqK family antitoxin [Flavobacteriales bacterium]
MKQLITILGLIALIGTYGIARADNPQADLPADSLNQIDENNLKQGFWIFYGRDKRLPDYDDDQKVEEGRYLDNRKSGIWKKYFASGLLQNEITYQNSRPNGYAKIYYSNGQLKEEGIWKGNKWTGDYTLYHENGEKYHEFNFNPKGKREGTQTYYYDNGKKMIEGDWADGKESGTVTEWHVDGSLKSVKNFEGGTLDPASVKHYDAPEEVVEAEAEEEEPSGTGVEVEEGEEIKHIGKFDGNGEHKLYRRDQQLSKDGNFVNNVLMDGKWYKYNRDGILQRIQVYKNGAYVGDAPMPTE